MKHETHDPIASRGSQLIAQFGQAALIRQADGSWRLRGGSTDDQLSAREWISLFQHEVVVQAG